MDKNLILKILIILILVLIIILMYQEFINSKTIDLGKMTISNTTCYYENLIFK